MPKSSAPPHGARRWVLGARPRTLPAAIVPVLVGAAAAADANLGGGRGLIGWRVVAAAVVALSLQVATNYVNDYADGERGTDDAATRVGPPRLVGSGLASTHAVKQAALVAFGVAGVTGAALATAVGPELYVVGAISMAAGWLYTGGPKPYGYLGLGEAFVFVFFGLVATIGAAYVQTEELALLPAAAAVPVGLLATALLVVNNLRDIPGDTLSGKRTLAVRLGDRRTRALYVVLLVGAVVCVPVVAGALDRPAAVLALAAIPLARRPVLAVMSGARGAELIPVLGATGVVQLVFGVGLAAGLWLSS